MWLWGGEISEDEDSDGDSPCWEQVMAVLQCLGLDSLATQIEEHVVGVDTVSS